MQDGRAGRPFSIVAWPKAVSGRHESAGASIEVGVEPNRQATRKGFSGLAIESRSGGEGKHEEISDINGHGAVRDSADHGSGIGSR